MLECVINFSEGRDASKLDAITAAIAAAPQIQLLAHELDPDHHRSVVTFAGPKDKIVEGAVRGIAKASGLMSIAEHSGQHPRVGIADVVPFIPLMGATMQDAIHAAHAAGARLWQELGIPVYFYGDAARDPGRARLEKTRRAGFDGRPPDIGDTASHPTAGASMVGARDFLIAYNVQLATEDVGIAQAIARKIRESSGGIPYVKSIGLYLASQKCAQVSMNLVNFRKTDLNAVYDRIVQEAHRLGTQAVAGEIIGLIPHEAYQQAPEFFHHAANFEDSRILENRLQRG